MAKSREVDGEKLARNKKRLQSLSIGTPGAIQNQSGRYPTESYKTGVVMEVKPQGQIVVKVDGSRRLTLSYTTATQPTHVEQPARHSTADRPREHSEPYLSSLIMPC